MIIRYIILIVSIISYFSTDSFGQKTGKLSPQIHLSDTTLANRFYDKAILYGEQALYDTCLFYLKNAGAIYEKAAVALNTRHFWEQYVKCLNGMGSASAKDHQGDKALEYYRKALQIATDKFGEYHAEVAISHVGIGEILGRDRALESYQKALTIRRALFGPNHPTVADCIQRFGVVCYQKDDYDGAINYFLKSLTILNKSTEKGLRELAYAYRMLGAVYSRKGYHDKAILNHKKEIEIELQFLDATHPLMAETYINMGLVYLNKGDYDTALEFFNKAISIVITKYGENHPDVSYIYIGNAYYRKGEYAQAIKYYFKTEKLKLRTPGNYQSELAQLYNNIGISYLELDSLDKSFEYLDKSLKIKLKIVGDNNRYVTSNYNNLGLLYLKKKEYARSIEYYEKTLKIRLQLYGEKHPDVADSYLYLAKARFKQNCLEEALNYLQKSIIASVFNFADLNIDHNPDLKNVYAKMQLLSALALKAEILERLDSSQSNKLKTLQASRVTSQLASDLIDQLRNEYETEGSKLMLGETAQQVYEHGIRAAFKLYKMTNSPDVYESMFRFCEKSKISVLLDAIRDLHAKQLGGIPDSLLEQEKDLKIELVFYDTEIQKEKLKKEKPDSSKIKNYEDHYFSLKREYEKLMDHLAASHPKYDELKNTAKTTSVFDLQKSLDDHSALVEYFLGDSSLYIFAITKNNTRISNPPITASSLSKIDSLRLFIIRKNELNFVKTAHQCYLDLIAPVSDMLENITHLIIIPHGRLCKIPFDVLLMKEPLHAPGRSKKISNINFNALSYMIKKFNISYNYSTTLFINQNKKNSKFLVKTQGEFLGLAPVFEEENAGHQFFTLSAFHKYLTLLKDTFSTLTRDGQSFCKLPFSDKEIENIAIEFGSKKQLCLLRAEASEENFKQLAGEYRYVHLATHSFIDEAQPALSGIAFYQPKANKSGATEDGILYAGETYNLNLKADLVVLSSCESGLGKLINGEGIMALTRGFLYSGARNVMMTLWQVTDESSSHLMIEFYRRMLAGKTYAEALRLAKLEMIKNSSSANPFYWSGFILIGK